MPMNLKLVAASIFASSSLLAAVPTPLGLQLYSVKDKMTPDVSAGMDLVKSLGFTLIETHDMYGLTPAAFKAQADAHGLKLAGGHFSYDRMLKDLPGVIADAKTLGLSFIIVAWVPHDGDFTVDEARVAAANFNRFGAAAKAAGMSFGFHTHGYEFKPLADGTSAYDVMLQETDPNLVFVEMDVFWVVSAGQDPVKMLRKNPTRYRAFHLKDMRKGATTGQYTGHAPVTDNVIIGDGRIDWPALIAEGRKDGVEYFFIEDETSDPVANIPPSITYLETLGLHP